MTSNATDNAIVTSSIETDSLLSNVFYTRPSTIIGPVSLYVDDAINIVYKLFQLHTAHMYQDNKTKIWTANVCPSIHYYFSNLNNPVIARTELDVRMQLEQYLVKRKGLLEVLNKYGQLPK